MKKLVFVAAAVAASLATPTFAADLPVKAPQMVAAPAPWSWTGFYVGGHVGWGWGTKEWSNVCDATGGGAGCFSPPVVADGNVDGFLGGLQVGYNYQIDRLVLGIEGDFSWADVSGSYSCFLGAATCSSKADWFGTLTGRIGGTIDHALLYVKGGAAWVHDDYNEYCASCGPATWAGSNTKLGWTLGAGVEYAFTRNWSAKLEYDYMDFGTTNVFMTGSNSNHYTVDIEQRIHVVKTGVNYKF